MTLGRASRTTHVDADIACGTCGYNLRTLRFEGRCPECGEPVTDTLDPRWLAVDHNWLRLIQDALATYFWCTIICLVILAPVFLLSGLMWLVMHTISLLVLTTRPREETIAGSGVRWAPRAALLLTLAAGVALVMTREPIILIAVVPLIFGSIAGVDGWLVCLAREWHWPAVRRAGRRAVVGNLVAAGLTLLAPLVSDSFLPSSAVLLVVVSAGVFGLGGLILHMITTRKALALLRRTRILWDPDESLFASAAGAAGTPGHGENSGDELTA